MAPLRSSVLYYPHINIEDDGLLRQALLLWDNIRTIVPGRNYTEERIDDYTQDLLRERGILDRLTVTSEIIEELNLEEEVESFLTDPNNGPLPGRDLSRLHLQKLSPASRRILDSVEMFRLHPQKLSERMNEMLLSSGRVRTNHEGEFSYVDSAFVDFYMTLLASRLAKTRGLGLLTGSAQADQLAGAALLDVTSSKRGDMDRFRRHERYSRDPDWEVTRPNQVQGILMHMVIDLVAPSPNADIKELLEFKDRHVNELGRLRRYLSGLASELEEIEDLEALRETASDLVRNEIRPALEDLESALKGFGFKHLLESTVKLSSLSTSATGGALGLAFGLSAPYALAAAAGVNIVCAAVSYREERRRQLRDSPLAFAHLLKKQHARRSRRDI